VKVVQPAESGVVREILVQEGQIVVKGDVLLRLDPTVASADRRSVVSQLTLKQLELRRIDAQLTGGTIQREPPDDPVLFAQVRSDGAARERAHRDQIAQEDDSRERGQVSSPQRARLSQSSSARRAATSNPLKLTKSWPRTNWAGRSMRMRKGAMQSSTLRI
jgi:HlyD family secretion protein